MKDFAASYTHDRIEHTAVMKELETLRKEKASWKRATNKLELSTRRNISLQISNRALKTKIWRRNKALRKLAQSAAACKPIILGAIERNLVEEGHTGQRVTDMAQNEYERHFCAGEKLRYLMTKSKRSSEQVQAGCQGELANSLEELTHR